VDGRKFIADSPLAHLERSTSSYNNADSNAARISGRYRRSLRRRPERESKGLFFITQAFVKHPHAGEGCGKIINISSVR